MKTVFDATFRYRPSFDTDVRKTFERARREQQARRRPAAPAAANATATRENAHATKVCHGEW